jgi:hypothetical protein
MDGFCEEETDVVVVIWLIVCVIAAEVLFVSFASPEYVAVI